MLMWWRYAMYVNKWRKDGIKPEEWLRCTWMKTSPIWYRITDNRQWSSKRHEKLRPFRLVVVVGCRR
jgi:hypothetical protein